MSPEEIEDMKNSLFPVGKERWIKVLFKDRDKCMKAFKWSSNGYQHDGYEVTAIGVRDEYVPQVQAISDLQDDLMGMLYTSNIEPYQLKQIEDLFKMRKEELKNRVIEITPNAFGH